MSPGFEERAGQQHNLRYPDPKLRLAVGRFVAWDGLAFHISDLDPDRALPSGGIGEQSCPGAVHSLPPDEIKLSCCDADEEVFATGRASR